MDNVLIDDRRIHVDFSQSVAKLHQWDRATTIAQKKGPFTERGTESKRNDEGKSSKKRGGLLNAEESEVQKEEEGKGPPAEMMTYHKNSEKAIEALKRIPEEDPGVENGTLEGMRDQEAERRSGRSQGRTDQAVETGGEGAENEVRAVRKGGEIDHVIAIDRVHRLEKSIGNSGLSASFLAPLTEPQYWSLILFVVK
ncbi:hypothetical protein ANCDUO_27470 [Ancylostoma duodenale]|uniref:Uncharacterized protein n=1 Tax=Ancylostoma duodenale TaxID=51022 RepID=A0A0C2F1Y5_9BILA|nr:hypothetical protein ANCDUO_27470 [Ancylostoma duodenale]